MVSRKSDVKQAVASAGLEEFKIAIDNRMVNVNTQSHLATLSANPRLLAQLIEQAILENEPHHGPRPRIKNDVQALVTKALTHILSEMKAKKRFA